MDYNRHYKNTKEVLGWFSDLLLEAVSENITKGNIQRAQYLYDLLIDQGRVLPGGKAA